MPGRLACVWKVVALAQCMIWGRQVPEHENSHPEGVAVEKSDLTIS